MRESYQVILPHPSSLRSSGFSRREKRLSGLLPALRDIRGVDRLPLTCPLDCRQQRLQIVRRVVAPTVDVERRRSVDSAPRSAQEVLVNPVRERVLRERGLESRNVETKLPGRLNQVRVVESPLVFEDAVVHLPELSLGGGGLGRLRRSEGERM